MDALHDTYGQCFQARHKLTGNSIQAGSGSSTTHLLDLGQLRVHQFPYEKKAASQGRKCPQAQQPYPYALHWQAGLRPCALCGYLLRHATTALSAPSRCGTPTHPRASGMPQNIQHTYERRTKNVTCL